MPDGLKAIAGIGFLIAIWIGWGAVSSHVPEPVRNVVDSGTPIVAAAGEVVDGVTDDAEDRFIAAAKRTDLYQAMPASRAEMMEMGYWTCVTTPQQRSANLAQEFPTATSADIATMSRLMQPIATAAHQSGLCG